MPILIIFSLLVHYSINDTNKKASIQDIGQNIVINLFHSYSKNNSVMKLTTLFLSSRRLIPLIAYLIIALNGYAQSGEYALKLYDSGGDGWNGAFITVEIEGEISALTLDGINDNGSFKVVYFTVEEDDLIELQFNATKIKSRNKFHQNRNSNSV